MEISSETDTNSLRSLLPEANREAVEMLYVIEVGLRELIIEALTASAGPKWFKTMLPADITEKYVRGRKAQAAASWSTHIEHHPLYYIDFPDLAKVLDKNWRNTFQDVLGNKEVFLGNLKALEPIRNTVAHNRKLSGQDCEIVRGVLTVFEAGIGPNRLKAFVENCTAAPAISEQLTLLTQEIVSAVDSMSSLKPPVQLKVWPLVQVAWWFDQSFLTNSNHAARLELAMQQLAEMQSKVSLLEREVERLSTLTSGKAPQIGKAIEDVFSFFQLFAEFSSLPRSRGSGHKIESWISEQDIEGKSQLALHAINSFLTHDHE